MTPVRAEQGPGPQRQPVHQGRPPRPGVTPSPLMAGGTVSSPRLSVWTKKQPESHMLLLGQTAGRDQCSWNHTQRVGLCPRPGGPAAEKGAPAAGCGGSCAQHAWPSGPTSRADLVTLVTVAQLCHDHPACWAFQDQTQTVQIPSQGPWAWRENDGRACVRGSQPQERRDQRSQARPRQGTCPLPPSRLPGCLSDWGEDQPCGLCTASALTPPQVAGPRQSSQSL